MDDEAAQTSILDATDRLFYEHGIRAVGMDTIRDASGVSLKRLYRLFDTKDQLAEATLRRRADAFHSALAARAELEAAPRERILAVFDHLYDWFSEPGFRGCPFINAHGEGHCDEVQRAVADQKRDFEALLTGLVAAAGGPDTLARQLLILANGAMATAAILEDPTVALTAKDAARALLDASL